MNVFPSYSYFRFNMHPMLDFISITLQTLFPSHVFPTQFPSYFELYFHPMLNVFPSYFRFDMHPMLDLFPSLFKLFSHPTHISDSIFIWCPPVALRKEGFWCPPTHNFLLVPVWYTLFREYDDNDDDDYD